MDEVLVGADEAGRGPVLGSMIVGAVATTDPALLPAGIRDSKELDDPEREILAEELREACVIDTAYCEVTPREIDSDAGSLNDLTIAAMVDAVGSVLPASVKTATVRLDACDVDPDRFGNRVRKRLSRDARVIAEHEADRIHPIVGAASVIAKSERERHVARLAAEFGDIGSGYPSDPTTASFLEAYVDEYGDLPPIARRSWRTSERLLERVNRSELADF